ncbi:Mss4-like protein [Scheffersomyces xylosifermentans]|uniref:Mss4-like protein n=1 Tax=Scheffersomyces xylosifermentans TaxID=1304137 RepID=UPI00315D096D
MEYSKVNVQDLVSEDKKVILRCPFKACNTRIIPLTKTLVNARIDVEKAPEMVKANSSASTEEAGSEVVSQFYRVNDVWDFDNVGVSRAVENLAQPIEIEHDQSEEKQIKLKIERLLICSECDKGPIGFAGLQESDSADVKNLKYFLSCSSVIYDVKE